MAIDSNIRQFNGKTINNAKVYKIQNGDTLNKIAQKTGKTVEELASMNNIKDVNVIYSGQDLIIDYDSIVEAPASKPSLNTSNGYIIQAGDTLNDIAKKYGTTADAIAKANGIKNINLIYAGQNLVIPSGDTPSNETPVVQKAPTPVRVNLSGNYTGILRSKTIASPSSRNSNGVITFNNQAYNIGTFTNARQGTLSQNDYIYLVGQVAGEGGLDCDDMLGVCSTILNRVEAGGAFGDTVEKALQIGYWPWGKTCNKYVNYDAYGNPIGFKSLEQLGSAEYGKLQNALRVVNDAMGGVRNVNKDTKYYGGDGTHNYFSDKV